MRERTVRLSQTVSPFGVGAIYDFRGESLVAADITKWGGAGDRILLERLAEDLSKDGSSVKEFRSAPARWSRFSKSGGRLPFVRFPRWLFCPTCRRMVLWLDTMEVEGEPARCSDCARRPQLVPMRFVVTCRHGHLGDVQWDRWAHAGASTDEQRQCKSKSLRFETKPGAGTGLEALIVRCTVCGSPKSLQGITSESAHPAIRCNGKQPWVYSEQPTICDAEPRVLQRGASNLYFAEVRSAIDIPPDSDFDVYNDVSALVTNAPEFQMLKGTSSEDMLYDLLIGKIAAENDLEEGAVRKVVEAAKAAIEGTPHTKAQLTGDLRRDEWNALVSERHNQDDRDRFITRHESLVRDKDTPEAHGLTAERIGTVVLVTRLREVRALKSFRRYDTDGSEVRPALDAILGWLPAIEVFGEGIFLRFDEEPLQRWEREEAVVRRVRKLEQRRQDSLLARRVKVASPRFVLLHTFAHLLIRRLSYESGYTAASLRERIYSAEAGGELDPFAGVLVYTAAGDSEGTLGGLVRQGRPPRMIETLMSMLEDAAWCSSDPICVESDGQGFQGLNRGACHACGLVAETSCEYSNGLLDRALLVGADGLGYFAEALDAAINATAAAAATES